MPRIPKSKVFVRRRYLVDCDVCGEAVEPESGGFDNRRMAEAAKQRHLEAHERTAAEDSGVSYDRGVGW